METKAEQKARRKEAVILRLMKGEKLPEVLKDYPDMKLSPATWSRLKKRYGRGGFEALIDHRKGLPYKLNPEIREFVLATKGSDPNLSSKELVGQVKEKYGLILSKSSINQILRKAGMSGRVGKRPGRVAAKVKAVPEEVKPPPEEVKVLPEEAGVLPEETKAPPREAEIPAEEAEAPAEKAEAPPEASPEEAKAPPKEAEIPPEAPPEEVKVVPKEAEVLPMEYAGCFFLKGADCDMLGSHTITRVVKGEVAKADKALMEESLSRKGALQSMNELLLYLPLFGVKGPEDLDPSKQRTLSLLIGSDKIFNPNEIERYLRNLEDLKLLNTLIKELARCSAKTLAVKVELEDGSSFCIDGHLKTIWQDEKIPASLSISICKIKSYIGRFFINCSKDDPLILSVCPGYIHPSSELFDLMEGFEGKKAIVELSTIGPDGLKIEAFKGIRLTKRYFIAYLSPWQYKGLEDFRIKNGFVEWETDLYHGRPKIADAEIDLIDTASDLKQTIRAVLIEEGEKLRALITDITPQEESDMRKIATAYFLRWPNKRERTFYDVIQERLRKSESSSSKGASPSPQEELSLLDLFRSLLENLNRYVQRQYFPPEYDGVGIWKMVESFYKQRGYVKKWENFITVTLERYDDPELQKAVEYACRKFNEGDVRTPEGESISIYQKTP